MQQLKINMLPWLLGESRALCTYPQSLKVNPWICHRELSLLRNTSLTCKINKAELPNHKNWVTLRESQAFKMWSLRGSQ